MHITKITLMSRQFTEIEFRGISQPMHNHLDAIMSMWRLRKSTNKIHSNMLSFPMWNGKWS
ncbi:hypothetical protein Scep_017020 [Stephania cephalantha]|uniref:Uncharacterized protein n=1 Tax=Stephania cephalantha TaxID=152367 RepID=A0AAP0NT72_9MAGN